MSDNNLAEVVGEDVNLAAEQPQEVQQSEQTPETPQTTEQTDPAQPESRVVPLAALHEERTRRKELAASLEQMRQEQARRDQLIEQRLAALTQARQEPVPSFEENPALHLQSQIQQVQQTSQATAQQIENWQRQQQFTVAVQQLSGAVQQHEAQFSQSNPDYIDAVGFLRNQRAAELAADGMDEGQAVAKAGEELRNLALERAYRGQNAAEVAYKLAKARGFTAKPAQQAQPTPAERLANQQKGVAAAKTLGSGGPASNKITAETLASMSDDEFAELTKGNAWQKIMGG